MKTSEMRDLDDGGLLEHLQVARREMFGLRFQHATGELENTSALRASKKEIARALTLARERGLEVANERTGRRG